LNFRFLKQFFNSLKKIGVKNQKIGAKNGVKNWCKKGRPGTWVFCPKLSLMWLLNILHEFYFTPTFLTFYTKNFAPIFCFFIYKIGIPFFAPNFGKK